jgi:RND family efflux transporter MFP subunit
VNLWSVALLLALGAGAGCNRHSTPAPKGGADVKPGRVVLQRNVELAPVERRSLTTNVETVGVLEAEGQPDIAAGVSGIVDEVLFREGDEVTPETVLVKVDQVRYTSEEATARSNVERTQAALNLARDLSERAERAGRGVAEEEKVKLRGSVRVLEAELRGAQAALTKAQNNLTKSRVKAPYPGRINKRMVTRGSYLEDKTVIATMADLSQIRLAGFVPEIAAPQVSKLLAEQPRRLEAVRTTMPFLGFGDPWGAWGTLAGAHLRQTDYVVSGYDPEFKLLAVPGATFHGRLFYMSTVAQPDTHMFEAKAQVLGWKPEALQSGKGRLDLRPGFTAQIRFVLQSDPNALVVPEEAIRATERGFVVFVPVEQRREDGKTEWVVKMRTVQLGYRAEGWVEVRDGLQLGEQVVRRGAEALEDGTPVRFAPQR